MNPEKAPIGMALRCDLQGAIQQVIRDEVGLPAQVVPEQPFNRVVDSGSIEKSYQFLA